MNLAGAVYLLCAATSLLCAIMLFHSYARERVPLLMWSGLCFAGLTLDNLILYVDIFIVPDVDLSIVRKLPGLVAFGVLVFGLVWNSE